MQCVKRDLLAAYFLEIAQSRTFCQWGAFGNLIPTLNLPYFGHFFLEAEQKSKMKISDCAVIPISWQFYIHWLTRSTWQGNVFAVNNTYIQLAVNEERRQGAGAVSVKKEIRNIRWKNKHLYWCTHKWLSLILHKLACILHQVCHSTSLYKFDFSEGKMSGLVPFWFPLNSLFTQIKLLQWLVLV